MQLLQQEDRLATEDGSEISLDSLLGDIRRVEHEVREAKRHTITAI